MPPRGTTPILGSQGAAGALGQTDTQTEELLARAAAIAQVYALGLLVNVTPRRPAGHTYLFHLQVARPDGVPVGGYYILRFAICEMQPGFTMFDCAAGNQADEDLDVDRTNGADRIVSDRNKMELMTNQNGEALVLVKKALFTSGMKAVAGVETGPMTYVNFYEMRDAQ